MKKANKSEKTNIPVSSLAMFGLKTHPRSISVVPLLLHSHYLSYKAMT